MRKRSKIITTLMIISLLVITLLPRSLVFAKSGFFSIESTQAEKGDTLVMRIYIHRIDYEKFTFKLTSNVSLSQIDASQSLDNLKSSKDVFAFDFDQDSSSVTSVTLKYKIADDVSVGDTLTFHASVTSANEEDEVLKSSVSVKIIAGKDEEESSQESSKDERESSKSEREKEKKTQRKTPNKSFKKNSTSQPSQVYKGSTGRVSQTPKVTYNGSSNNYLCSLSVTHYSFNRTFRKEGLNYFISVARDVKSVKVNATPDDSKSQVYINGNSDLKAGMNKVLITVVAKNGNIRHYRIFVKKAS